MVVGLCRITLRLPENRTLKGKREVVQSITTRVRNKFNVSMAEVGDNDLWQLLTLGVSVVSNDARHANQVLSQVVNYVQNVRASAELVDYQIEVTQAL